ncbi:MAG: domain S-box protein [Bacteroidetes bacterium]|jgi:PAS domain S-box-containing protein|nr:domain S-box protein [Bacteroidota bacterium]
MINKLLQRQIQKHIKDPANIPPDFKALLNVISESYDHHERENKLLERSIDLSSKELIELNQQLKKDILEREKTEKKIKAVNKELNILFENLDEHLFSVDMVSSNLIQMSAGCKKIYGYEPFEFFADKSLWKKVIHPEDQVIAELQLESLRLGKRVLNRYRIIHKDNGIRWIENKIIPTVNANGKLERIDGITNDITERIITEQKIKQNETLLVSNEKKYRSLFQSNPMPMWLIDADTYKFLDVNTAAISHYGYSRAEFLSMSALDIRPDAERQRFLDYSRSKTETQSNRGIWEHVKKDGTVINVEISLDHIDFEGMPAHLILANDVTERLVAEKKLKLSNERYELAMRATHDAVWDWNLVNSELYWSEGYETLFGYKTSEEEVNINSWISRIHPEDVKRVTEGVIKQINEPEAGFWQEEYRYIKADGNIAHVYDRGYIVYNENRVPIRMVGAMSDITNRKKAEEIYQKSEANLRNILENTDTAYVLLDENAKILSFNSSAVMLAQSDLKEPIAEGKNYVDLLANHRKTEVKQAIRKVLTEAKTLNYEIRYDNEFGLAKWLHVRINPIMNIEGRIMGVSVAATNITERKISENMLRKSEANLRTIFDNADISYVLLDKKFRVVSHNQKAAITFRKELHKELAEGSNFISLLPKDRNAVSRNRYELVLRGSKITYEQDFTQKDGTVNWYSINAFPVYDELKNILGLIIAAEDITSRKYEELEKEKITSDLIQRNKTLEQFAYIISHNLRSPVANITGLSNIILNSPSMNGNDFKKCMEGLALSVKKLDDVIIDLNYILQVRREINEKKEAVSFSGLIRDIKTSINTIIEKEQITIKTNFMHANELFAIKSYLNSIFYNLISNSIKYRNPNQKPVIEINSTRTNNKIQLSFRDNGLGIDMEANGNKIFGLYKKFHNHIEGKGMGLYMVKTQVEILGGKIDVKSEVNKGTEFLLEFEV